MLIFGIQSFCGSCGWRPLGKQLPLPTHTSRRDVFMLTVKSSLYMGVHDADGSVPDPLVNQACHEIQAVEAFSFLAFFVCTFCFPSNFNCSLTKPIAQCWATLLYYLYLLALLLRVGIRRGFRLSRKLPS